MAEFITLSCPSCGGQLQITNDIERFACAHCGNEHVVRRSGGVVTIAPLVEGLRQVQRGTDRTAAELALQRLREEVPVLEGKLQNELSSAMSSPQAIKNVLQKIGKVSFVEYSFVTNGTVRKRFEALTDEEIEAAIKTLEKGFGIFNQGTINRLRTIKGLKAQLREKQARMAENLKIADGK